MNKLISFFAFHYLVGKVFTIHYMLIYSRMTIKLFMQNVHGLDTCDFKNSEKIEIGNIFKVLTM